MSRLERTTLAENPLGRVARSRAGAWYHTPVKAGSPKRKPRWGAEYFVTRGWLHLVLLTGVCIFIFPLLWMAATSMKTDEELTDGRWLPATPMFVARSPYVRPAPEPVKPIGVDALHFQRYAPVLADVTRSAVDRDPAAARETPELREAAAAVLFNRMVARLPAKLWMGEEGPLKDAYAALLTSETIREAIANRLARLEIRGLLFRTLDASVTRVCDPKTIAETWKVESGSAKLVPIPEGGAYVEYDFGNHKDDDQPIALHYEFDCPTDFDQLHRLMVSYKADNSWHRVDVTVDVNGQHWEGRRATYLAQTRPGSILLQPPTFEDESMKNKLWVPLRLVSTSGMGVHNNPRRATLRLTISPSSTLEAIGAKMQYNYDRAFHFVPFWKYVVNSAILVVLCTAGTLFSSTFVAYAFARLRWPGRSVAFVLLLSTMMLPAQVTMIPQFMVWRQLGWYNTLNPLWVPAWFGIAFFIFLMVQHMKTIPRELEEAARIDGLNAVQTWWYVIVPLVKPAAAAIAIMAAMGAWNDFLGPLIYLRDQAKFPLSLGLWGMRTDFTTGVDWTLLMAGNVLMTLPVVLLFFFFQRYFIQGMTMSGMKG
jgi:ABC-type glycerol-3-phosphate transport system permease component